MVEIGGKEAFIPLLKFLFLLPYNRYVIVNSLGFWSILSGKMSIEKYK